MDAFVGSYIGFVCRGHVKRFAWISTLAQIEHLLLKKRNFPQFTSEDGRHYAKTWRLGLDPPSLSSQAYVIFVFNCIQLAHSLDIFTLGLDTTCNNIKDINPFNLTAYKLYVPDIALSVCCVSIYRMPIHSSLLRRAIRFLLCSMKHPTSLTSTSMLCSNF